MSDQRRVAVSAPERLRRRRDFLSAAKGFRSHARAFTLQAAPAVGREDALPRFGFTVTKKIGSAVERNRIRRRLREVVRLMSDSPATPGFDYVIVARREALHAPFADLAADLRRAIELARRQTRRASRKTQGAPAAAFDRSSRPAADEQDQASGS